MRLAGLHFFLLDYWLKINNIVLLQAIRSDTKADIERRLDTMTEQLVDEVRRITNANKEFAAIFTNGDVPQNRRYNCCVFVPRY